MLPELGGFARDRLTAIRWADGRPKLLAASRDPSRWAGAYARLRRSAVKGDRDAASPDHEPAPGP